jgi:hypothetical protein
MFATWLFAAKALLQLGFSSLALGHSALSVAILF